MAQVARELAPAPLPIVALPSGWTRGRLVLVLTVLFGVLALIAVSLLTHTANLATSGYSIQRLQTERDLWRMRNDQLRLELAKVRSLTWVEHEAVSRLGMRKAAQPTYLPMLPAVDQPAIPPPAETRGR